MTADIEIFTEQDDAYCIAAKRLLTLRRLTFLERELSCPDNRAELQKRLKGEVRTLQVFIGGEHIGGFEDLKHHLLYIVLE